MNYEKKYKLLREAVMLGERDPINKKGLKTEYGKAYFEGRYNAYLFLKGYIEQMLEDSPCEEVVEKMKDEIKEDYNSKN